MFAHAVSAAVTLTPVFVTTFFHHYYKYSSYRGHPKHKLTYHEGVDLIDAFLFYSSFHTVERLQRFTSHCLTHSASSTSSLVYISDDVLDSAANIIVNQLGSDGVASVGGERWWRWRGSTDTRCKAEWIEMSYDRNHRIQTRVRGNRVILYLHGGAYFFGSVNSHRSQIEKHAKMLKAKAFARSHFRLAPQFPFPCALQDSLAAYLYLLAQHDANEITLIGDSSGAGLILSVMVTLRDQSMPLPAGAVLISPWVDLTCSFPSMASKCPDDFIPPYGFIHKPSMVWPPPNTDQLNFIAVGAASMAGREDQYTQNSALPFSRAGRQSAVQGFSVSAEGTPSAGSRRNSFTNHAGGEPKPGSVICPPLTADVGDKTVEIKDQIFMYTTNDMLAHPLVSPIFQPSLGGLSPTLILSGGGERLRDEHVYLAHKMARPQMYPPNDEIVSQYDPTGRIIAEFPPTKVQFQVYDDFCHEALTLGYATAVKYAYRAVGKFAAWSLEQAQGTPIDIRDMHNRKYANTMEWGKSGDNIHAFVDDMIRERVDIEGNIYPMESEPDMGVLQIETNEIGSLHPQVVLNWLAGKQYWDNRAKKKKLKLQRQWMDDILYHGEWVEPGEFPPACSLASRYRRDTEPAVKEPPLKRMVTSVKRLFKGDERGEFRLNEVLEKSAQGARAQEGNNPNMDEGRQSAMSIPQTRFSNFSNFSGFSGSNSSANPRTTSVSPRGSASVARPGRMPSVAQEQKRRSASIGSTARNSSLARNSRGCGGSFVPPDEESQPLNRPSHGGIGSVAMSGAARPQRTSRAEPPALIAKGGSRATRAQGAQKGDGAGLAAVPTGSSRYTDRSSDDQSQAPQQQQQQEEKEAQPEIPKPKGPMMQEEPEESPSEERKDTENEGKPQFATPQFGGKKESSTGDDRTTPSVSDQKQKGRGSTVANGGNGDDRGNNDQDISDRTRAYIERASGRFSEFLGGKGKR